MTTTNPYERAAARIALALEHVGIFVDRAALERMIREEVEGG